MAITTQARPNVGSATVEIIDGIEFPGLGSGGFGPNDFLIRGDEADNVLIGGSGHDLIEGKDGNDAIYGGEGNDTLGGGDGNDDLNGQEGTDKLFGDSGNDILRAGYGHDILRGGEGNDIFGFYALGHYEVQDFTIEQDRLAFDTVQTGINNIGELNQLITGIDQRADGVSVQFGPDGSVDLIGINFTDLTADMVIFAG